jgi:LacI family transcriptional regulator
MAHVEKVGYAPNLLAQSLQASKTFTLGLMLPDIDNPFFSTLAKHIQICAAESNYSILFVGSQENAEREKEQVMKMIGRKVDGIIAAPVSQNTSHFDQVLGKNIPLVFVDRYSSKDAIPFVSSDNRLGCRIAVEEFITNGHTRIALVSGDPTSELVQERIAGYKEGHIQSRIDIVESLIVGQEFSIEAGRKALRSLMAGEKPPTALLAMNNLIGLGVLLEARELGVDIPTNLSLIVFDDLPYFSLLDPPVSAVYQNAEAIAKQAVQNLLESITGDAPKVNTLIPTRLIRRKSVKNIKN